MIIIMKYSYSHTKKVLMSKRNLKDVLQAVRCTVSPSIELLAISKFINPCKNSLNPSCHDVVEKQIFNNK